MQLVEIRRVLRNKSSKKAKESTKKFVPTIKKYYGTRAWVVNEILKNIKELDSKLVEQLWKSGFFEEQLLASKILGKFCLINPDKTLKLIRRFSKDIIDWAICDTLATQGVKKIIKIKQKEIFKISKELIKSNNLWQRRFALVLLINYQKDKKLRKEIKNIMKQVENDQEYYVKKALIWLKNGLK